MYINLIFQQQHFVATGSPSARVFAVCCRFAMQEEYKRGLVSRYRSQIGEHADTVR